VRNPSATRITFYLLTDPETADRIADRGFAGAGVWSQHAAVTLFDQPIAGSGGAVMRVSLTHEAARELQRHRVEGADDATQTFAAPLHLLENAYVVRIAE
jgi:hypothetical protein